MADPKPSVGVHTIDLRQVPLADRIELKPLPLHSREWAKHVQPIAMALLGIIAFVMLLPFLIILTSDSEKAKNTLDWAKTVLPPVVGFGGALVGYYFGTRGTQQESPFSDQQADQQDNQQGQ